MRSHQKICAEYPLFLFYQKVIKKWYPLVNVYKKLMGKIHHAINGKIYYFYMAIFNSFLYVYRRVSCMTSSLSRVILAHPIECRHESRPLGKSERSPSRSASLGCPRARPHGVLENAAKLGSTLPNTPCLARFHGKPSNSWIIFRLSSPISR